MLRPYDTTGCLIADHDQTGCGHVLHFCLLSFAYCLVPAITAMIDLPAANCGISICCWNLSQRRAVVQVEFATNLNAEKDSSLPLGMTTK